MNILLLIDLAPNYHKLLVGLGKALNGIGHKTFYAIDSPLNLWRNPEHPPEGESRVFSEYLAALPESNAPATFPWRAFFPDFDRYENFGVNHDKKQDWYLHLGKALDSFFNACIRDWRIDAVVYEGVNNSYAFFANRAANLYGAKYLGIQSSRIPGRHELHGSSENVLRERIKRHYGRLESGATMVDPETEKLISLYLSGFERSTPDYMAGNGLLLENPISKYAKQHHVSTFLRLAKYQLLRRSPADASYRSGPPLTYSYLNAKRNAVRWLRSCLLKRRFQKANPSDSYYLYPIHFHPEASTSVNSRWYVDEYPAIKNLAFSLPPGTWLYVKDHPSAVAYPALRFYQSLSRLPNVKLISPGEDTKRLIRNSVGVITQTSTVGYEALILRKPVWVLGDVFYDFHPGCRKIGWNPSLEESFLAHAETRISESQALNLVTAYFMSTKAGMLPIWGESDSTVSYADLALEIEQEIQQSA